MQKHTLVVSGAILGLGLLGCAGRKEIQQGAVYPSAVRRGTTLDIQVVRRGTRIEFTNTTARSFGKSVMWLNGRYSKDIDGLAIGQTMTLPLRQFKDEYGESFRGGGFFATEKPEMLALAELQPWGSDDMVGLIVITIEE